MRQVRGRAAVGAVRSSRLPSAWLWRRCGAGRSIRRRTPTPAAPARAAQRLPCAAPDVRPRAAAARARRASATAICLHERGMLRARALADAGADSAPMPAHRLLAPFRSGSVRCGHPGLRVRQRRVRRSDLRRLPGNGNRFDNRGVHGDVRGAAGPDGCPPVASPGDLPRVRPGGRLLRRSRPSARSCATPMRARLPARLRFPSATKASASTPSALLTA